MTGEVAANAREVQERRLGARKALFHEFSRGVVDEDELEVVVGLIEKALEVVGEKSRVVVAGGQDRDQGRRRSGCGRRRRGHL